MTTTASAPPRLFFALWPDEATREALAGWSQAMHKVCGGRRTRSENLHATLAFLGATEQARLAALDAAAARVHVPSFDLILDRPGYWKHKRIAWAGASAVPIALSALAENLRAALSLLGFSFDTRPFAPHVTLARDADRAPQLPSLPPVHWPVADFSLVLSPGGRAAYRVLATWPLR
jgi:RNA 2',3'-cyclic 3'-phosphodiesterase